MNILEKIGFGICIGAVAGVTAGFIIGTKEGRMMRKTLKEKALNTIDNLEEHVQDGSKEWNATAAHAAEKANRVIRNIGERADDLQQDLAHGYSKVKHDVKHERKITMNILEKIGFGICIGAVAGVTAGFIIGTKEGRMMRKTLKEKALNTIDNLEDHVQDGSKEWNATAAHAAEKANRVIRNIDEKADDLQQDLAHGYSKVKHDVKQTVATDMNQGKAMEKKWQDKLGETIDTIKGAVEEKKEDISDAANHASVKAKQIAKDVANASEDAGQEIKDGYHAIKHDLHRPGQV